MNPLIRRRLAPSLRTLLTDIVPKEEWTETEGDSVNRNGILLPSRGRTWEQEEFLTPAKAQKTEATEEGSNGMCISICMLCKSKPSCYTCPRCNLCYCGLACYQSPDHSVCSEEFYKESVLQELKNMGKTESEGRKKMQEILMGIGQEAERTEGGMECLLKEAGIVSDDMDTEQEAPEKALVVKLLSRLAEIQQSEEPSATEIEDILRKLGEIGGCELPGIEDTENEEGELDLADRLSGLDIDKLSDKDLWELLNSKEKETFLGLMKGGALGGLVPPWKPWWEDHEEGGRPLVEELSEEMSKLELENPKTMDIQDVDNKVKKPEKVQRNSKVIGTLRTGKGRSPSKTCKGNSSAVSTVPPISAKIPKLSSLCKHPSPLVCYGIVNALFGYTFTLSLFNGDTDSLMFEFCDMILALSEALNSSKVFSSVQEAIGSGERLIIASQTFDNEDPLASARAVEAVAHIVTGRDKKDTAGYCLAALSQLRSVLSQARRTLPKEEEGARRPKYFLASKKCEFFQAWLLENTLQIREVAFELWHEHSRKESARKGLKKAKIEVEQILKNEKRKGTIKLVEELS